jgi:hypothetical protein
MRNEQLVTIDSKQLGHVIGGAGGRPDTFGDPSPVVVQPKLPPRKKLPFTHPTF